MTRLSDIIRLSTFFASVLLTLALSGCEKTGLADVPLYDIVSGRIEAGDTVCFDAVLADIPVNVCAVSPTADANALRSLFYLFRNQSDSSVFYANAVLSELSSRPDSASSVRLAMSAQMYRVLAESNLRRGNYDAAQKYIFRGLSCASRSKSLLELARLHIVKSAILRDVRNYRDCLKELRCVEVLLDTTTYSKSSNNSIAEDKLTRLFSDAAKVYIDLSHVNASTRFLSKASTFFEKSSACDRVAYLQQLTRLHVLTGEFSKASTSIMRIEMLLTHSQSPASVNFVQSYKRLVNCRLGNSDGGNVKTNDWAFGASTDDWELCSIDLLSKSLFCNIHGDRQEAMSILCDSIRFGENNMPYVWVLYNDCRTFVATSSGDYKRALEIQDAEKLRLVNFHNELFSFDDAQRSSEMLNAFFAQKDAVYSAELRCENKKKACFIFLISFVLIGVLTLSICLNNKMTSRKSSSLNSKHEISVRPVIRKEQTTQNTILSATSDRIAESISYAEHIQQAVLPSPESLNKYPISGSFVFYSPLDVVSGDFFWFTCKGDELIMCCADCTGHGVPGALLSMVSATLLNNICNELGQKEADPGEILEKLDDNFVNCLSNNRDRDTKDGLDASLVVLNLVNHSVKISAARRPVILTNDGKLLTVRGTKRGIGDVEKIVRQRKFETTTVQLNKGDSIYMYSDGYSDQFGGQKGEKLKNSMVEKLISKIYMDDMDQQCLSIQEMLVQWKGDCPQTDDITFVGVCV